MIILPYCFHLKECLWSGCSENSPNNSSPQSSTGIFCSATTAFTAALDAILALAAFSDRSAALPAIDIAIGCAATSVWLIRDGSEPWASWTGRWRL